MEYEYTLHACIDDIPEDEWTSLRRGDRDPRQDPRHLRVVEKTLAGQGQFFYAIFRDGLGAPLADAHLCCSPLDLKQFLNGGSKASDIVARFCSRLFRPTMLYCSLPLRFLQWVSETGQRVAIRSLDRMLRRVAAERGAQWIVLTELTDEHRELLDGLDQHGYLTLPAMPMNHAAPVYRDFDEFCAGETSQHRWTINRSRKKFGQAGLRVVQMAGGEGADRIFTDDVWQLYEAVRDHAEIKMEKRPPQFFRELARALPDQTSFTFIYQGDRVVAFTCALFNEAVYRSILCGFDYELNARCDLYFNLSFLMMDDAYRRGVSQDIVVGTTADTFKREKLGCYQRPLYVCVKGTRPLLSSLVVSRLAKAAAHYGNGNGNGNGKNGTNGSHGRNGSSGANGNNGKHQKNGQLQLTRG